jgi:hypothetical protein
MGDADLRQHDGYDQGEEMRLCRNSSPSLYNVILTYVRISRRNEIVNYYE